MKSKSSRLSYILVFSLSKLSNSGKKSKFEADVSLHDLYLISNSGGEMKLSYLNSYSNTAELIPPPMTITPKDKSVSVVSVFYSAGNLVLVNNILSVFQTSMNMIRLIVAGMR